MRACDPHVNWTSLEPFPWSFTLIERFTPVGPNTLQWQVTFNDPGVWTRPFTFAMPLTRDSSQPIFEYASHEGNRGLEHILSAARAEDRK
jgi:hypothetical protein